jgi:hypothetical protein
MAVYVMGCGRGGRPSVAVVFALMAQGEDGDGGAIGDLEQDNVAGPAEGNDQFAQKGIASSALRQENGIASRNS